MENEHATGFDKKAIKSQISRDLVEGKRKKKRLLEMPDEVCVLIAQWSFQYFNHPHWESRGDGSCYITSQPTALYFSFIVLL